MQLHRFAAASHELIGNLLIFDGEVKDVGFYCGTACVLVRSSETGLDQLSLVGLPDVTLVDELVELSGLDSVTEDEVEPEIDESCQSQRQDDTGPCYDLALRCHDRLSYIVSGKFPPGDRGDVGDHRMRLFQMAGVVRMPVSPHVAVVVVHGFGECHDVYVPEPA